MKKNLLSYGIVFGFLISVSACTLTPTQATKVDQVCTGVAVAGAVGAAVAPNVASNTQVVIKDASIAANTGCAIVQTLPVAVGAVPASGTVAAAVAPTPASAPL